MEAHSKFFKKEIRNSARIPPQTPPADGSPKPQPENQPRFCESVSPENCFAKPSPLYVFHEVGSSGVV